MPKIKEAGMRHIRAKSIFPGRVRGVMAEFKKERFAAFQKEAQNPRIEYQNFKSALRQAQTQLITEKKMMLDKKRQTPHGITTLDDAIGVLESHILTLEDPYFLGEIKKLIFTTGATAAAALGAVISTISRQLSFDTVNHVEGKNNRHFVHDMNDMKHRILHFLGVQHHFTLPKGVTIVAAAKLTVSEVLALKRSGVRGIVIGNMSDAAHEIVMLRAMRIPCVAVSDLRFFRLRKQIPVIIDADIGYIVLRPRKSMRFIETPIDTTPPWSQNITLPSGEKISLSAPLHFLGELNNFSADTRLVKKIGIYRTEYQISEAGELLSTKQLTKQYESLFTRFPKTEITFRLFDFSEDKNFVKNPRIEKNHDLRGIRFLIAEKKILESQLNALIKAAENTRHNLRILIPYLSEMHELHAIWDILQGILPQKKKFFF
ncbi:MAG TPA: phosphoenolpyruvate-utilizing N-terminal domain-containing protein [Turneriella sp.]|nr:phosphoenolpyruvate-utilizing N-terminal domain-containing protein [Turneriella sp.]